MMSRPSPAALPGIVKAAVVVTFLNTWVFFEDPSSIATACGKNINYRVAKLCAWDIGALALIIWITFRVLRRARRPAAGV